jgi:hypothetical protein
VAAASCGILFFLCIRFWPFEQKLVIDNLQEASDSRVQVRAFRHKYLPYPGCELDGVVFTRGTGPGKPLIEIEKLTIQSTYPGILAHHLSLIIAEGMRVTIPPFGSAPPFHTTRSKITVGEIVANGATLDFVLRGSDKQPLRFDIREASLHDVGWKGPFTYRVRLHNPTPPGEITAEGKFGVWNQSDPAQTPLSGEYSFEHADLSIYHGVAGTLSSKGNFGGSLGHIDISGTTDTPDFTVKMGGHPMHLKTQFSAYVDGTRGDTFLKRVDAHFRKTQVVATGSIAKGANDKRRVALLDLIAENGRIEDILSLFVKKDRPPMSGEVTLTTKVELPSGDEPFLKRVRLWGNFGIGGGKFSKSSTQEGVNKLSAGALGEKDPVDPETVLTDLTGQATLTNGTATLADLSFGVPGAAARMRGTYDLIGHKIDLRGQLQVDSKISNTTHGVKAFLLKMMDPFFKKRKQGEILPVRISGTYEHPSFGLSIEDEKAEHVPAPKPKPARPL